MAKHLPQLSLAFLLVLVALTGCMGSGGSDSCALDATKSVRGIYKGTSSLPYDATATKRILVSTGGNRANVCTGTALSARVILTAAHCFYGVTNPAAVVVQDLRGGGLTNSPVESFTVHPDSYHPPAGTNLEDIGKQTIDPGVDIAVVITKTEIPEPYAKVVDMPSNGGEPLHILGYGDTSNGSALPTKVLLAPAFFTQFYDMEVSTPSGKAIARNSVIETRPDATGAIACQGDSGGPLVIASMGMQGLIGVTSGVNQYGCGQATTAQFTRIASLAAWINSAGGTYLSAYRLQSGACN